MSGQTPRHIAIVGSGPSGCFVAQALKRQWPDADVTIFDRLAAPYGLIRYGVAADHQHTKSITRQFDRSFQAGDYRFAGNVEVGADVTLDELRDAFDLVVLATGRWRDRMLSVPGSRLAGVIPSGDIINALNSVPRPALPMPEIGKQVVVVGAGNVAIDMVRFLIKDASDYDGSDVNPVALGQYLSEPATKITVLSRSPIATAKADVAMIRELAKVPGVTFSYANSSPAADDNKLGKKREEAFAQLAELEVDQPRAHVHFIFGADPARVLGTTHVTGIQLAAAPAGQASEVEADTIISAIGFDVNAPGHWHYATDIDFSPSDLGFIEPGLYRSGWLKRGPVGAIPANRADSVDVAKEIVRDFEKGKLPIDSSKQGFPALPDSVHERAISYTEWQRIDAAEQEAAPANRIRKKFPDHESMVRAAKR
ncbi:FAD-dependent oxidoreductase [Gulosibacter hominis]|uniref:FAD-dependent oxidoreductase n=1 Tax=Gulosibacter hominis TaxID=2770504 RepID=UPI00191AF68B|nr:FAD-dependent oxidoreductase [Gulosibacter hominis]